MTNFGGSLATTTGGGFGAAGGGTAGFAGGNAGLVQGFVGLTQQLQQIRNTQASLNSQVRTLGLLEANLSAGTIDIAQVDILRQNIETERANLLNAQVVLANTLDNFKVNTLGLPPNTPVEIDDSLVEQFRLVDPATTAVQYKIDDFIDILGDMPKKPSEENLHKAIDVVVRLREMVATRFEAAHKDLQKLEEATPKRLRTLSKRQQTSFLTDKKKLIEALDDLEKRFADTQGMLDEKQSSPLDDASKAADELVNLSSSLSGMTQELSLVQARARLESVTIDPVMINPKRAIDIARANRLDWMNNRMSLVDTWRLIAFNANALKSGLTVSFNGAVNTTNKNPVNFNGNTGTLSTTVEFDTPLTRRLERNNFRQALISYQQTRRQMILFQDQIYQRLRNYLRTLRQLQVLLEIQRRAVVIAVRRVDQTARKPQRASPGPAARPAGRAALADVGLELAQRLVRLAQCAKQLHERGAQPLRNPGLRHPRNGHDGNRRARAMGRPPDRRIGMGRRRALPAASAHSQKVAARARHGVRGRSRRAQRPGAGHRLASLGRQRKRSGRDRADFPRADRRPGSAPRSAAAAAQSAGSRAGPADQPDRGIGRNPRPLHAGGHHAASPQSGSGPHPGRCAAGFGGQVPGPGPRQFVVGRLQGPINPGCPTTCRRRAVGLGATKTALATYTKG